MIIYIKLGIANYLQGYFINIKKENDDLIGMHNEQITFQLGKNDATKYEGKINRTATPIKTPRLMLGPIYKNWVQANFKLGDTMKVEIVNQNKIILYAKGEEH